MVLDFGNFPSDALIISESMDREFLEIEIYVGAECRMNCGMLDDIACLSLFKV
jgi:hypothetical protein